MATPFHPVLSLKVEVDGSGLDRLLDRLESQLDETMDALADSISSSWKSKAAQQISKDSDRYTQGIGVERIGSDEIQIQLAGKAPNEIERRQATTNSRKGTLGSAVSNVIQNKTSAGPDWGANPGVKPQKLTDQIREELDDSLIDAAFSSHFFRKRV